MLLNDPISLDPFIGQQEVVDRLETWMTWAIQEGKQLPHTLLVSEPGLGKTKLVRGVAAELGRDLYEVDLSKVSPSRLEATLMDAASGILFLDEVHMAKPKEQEQLLLVAEEGFLLTRHGHQYDVEDLTIIAATTKPQKLDAAFRDRFTIQLTLHPYAEDDMVKIVHHMATSMGIAIPEGDAVTLARAACGVPRTARHLVAGYRTLGEDACAEEALRLLGLQSDGLGDVHIQYLQALKDFGGQLGEAALARVLRLHPSVLYDVESRLLGSLVKLTPSGRVITRHGLERLRQK